MIIDLIHCPHCGKTYKITRTKQNNGRITFITDFNDEFNPDERNNYRCISCRHLLDLSKDKISTFDWVADALFRVKG